MLLYSTIDMTTVDIPMLEVWLAYARRISNSLSQDCLLSQRSIRKTSNSIEIFDIFQFYSHRD